MHRVFLPEAGERGKWVPDECPVPRVKDYFLLAFHIVSSHSGDAGAV
jgi:hypothetical protein